MSPPKLPLTPNLTAISAFVLPGEKSSHWGTERARSHSLFSRQINKIKVHPPQWIVDQGDEQWPSTSGITHINLGQYIPLPWSVHGMNLGSFLGISGVFLKLFLPTFPFFIIRSRMHRNILWICYEKRQCWHSHVSQGTAPHKSARGGRVMLCSSRTLTLLSSV